MIFKIKAGRFNDKQSALHRFPMLFTLRVDHQGFACTSRPTVRSPKLLDLIGVRATENTTTLAARTSSRVARCPVCGARSARVHSHYTRTLADLPWQGVPVTES